MNVASKVGICYLPLEFLVQSTTKMTLTWLDFLENSSEENRLSPAEQEVLLCLQEAPGQSKYNLLTAVRNHNPDINLQSLTARLRNIYRAYSIDGVVKDKLIKLHKQLSKKFKEQQAQAQDSRRFGLTTLHSSFPLDKFVDELRHVSTSSNPSEKRVDIMQTFAPNLESMHTCLCQCLENRVTVRILLAWPYSRVASLREQVLRRYGSTSYDDKIDIRHSVIANLEILSAINKLASQSIDIRLYDTLPTMAVYRAGNTIYASPFLYGSLAVDTFQLELTIHKEKSFVANQILDDFERMWELGKEFTPRDGELWQSDLKILFSEV
jgi:hypothetical protein